jgi:acetyl esterase
MALDDATAALLANLAEAGGPPIEQLGPAQARAVSEALGDLSGAGPALHSVRGDTIAADDGYNIPVRVYSASENTRGVIVYFHGGGWVIGSVDQYDALSRRLAEVTNCGVVVPDYRLAPEYPYPYAARDAWDVTNWASASWPTEPLIVAGDSAGGNLAAVVAQRAVAEAGPPLVLQILIYPVTNYDVNTDTYLDPANQLLLGRDTMIWFWNHYTPDPATRLNPDVSPLQGDPSGTPPALVLLAEYDVLRAEGEAYAALMADRGTTVQLTIFEGQMHGFFQLINVLPGAEQALRAIVEHVQVALGT